MRENTDAASSYIPPVIFALFPRPFRVAIAVVGLALSLSGCQKPERPQTLLAQANQSRLTLEDLRESFPPELEKVLSRDQYLAFIQQWIEDEVVYQQALKGKLDADPKVKRKLESMRRKVLIEEFLAREEAADLAEPDEGAMSRYYESHKDAFRRSAPEFRYLDFRSGSVKEALALRARIKGENFPVDPRHARDTAAESSSRPFRKAGEIPACLLRDLVDAKPGFLSAPINCPDGVYLVKLIDRIEAGTPIAFAEAKDAIAAQLAMERKDKSRAAKISQYKAEAAISFNLDRIPGVETPPPENPEPEAAGLSATPPPAKPTPRKPSAPKHRRRPVPTPTPAPPVEETAPAPQTPAAPEPATPPEPSPASEGNPHAPDDTATH